MSAEDNPTGSDSETPKDKQSIQGDASESKANAGPTLTGILSALKFETQILLFLAALAMLRPEKFDALLARLKSITPKGIELYPLTEAQPEADKPQPTGDSKE